MKPVKERRAALGILVGVLAAAVLPFGSIVEKINSSTPLRIGFKDGKLGPSQVNPFADALSTKLGRPVTALFKTTHYELIEALKNSELEIAWLGPIDYLCAQDFCKAKTFLCNTNLKGNKTYQSYIIARSGQNIHTLNDLKGKTIALGDKASTAARIFPLYELKQAGLKANTDFSIYNAEANALQEVLSGTYPAGAVTSDDYDLALSQNKFRTGDLIILKKSDPIPQGPFAVRNDLLYDDILHIEDAFLTSADEDPSLMTTLGIGGFAKIEDNSYNQLRAILQDLGLKPIDLVKCQDQNCP